MSRAWLPPIGIPVPPFGINPIIGTPTHYVDNTHPAASDSNPNGTPDEPRQTIPSRLPAGAIVEVRGGPYNYGPGYAPVSAPGTLDQPVVIRGAGTTPPRFDTSLAVFSEGAGASYMVIEGLNLKKFEVYGPADHIVVRDCEVSGTESGAAVTIRGAAGQLTSHVVVLRCNIHDAGNWLGEGDQDVHGVNVIAHCSYVWVLDSTMTHCSGDGVQINAEGNTNQSTLHHIYVGRNTAWENRQTGFWTKQADDVVFSQNTVHSMRPIGARPFAWGAGMGFQYAPERAWFIFNHIYNTCFGIAGMGASGGGGKNVYIVGNLIHDVHHHPDYEVEYRPNTGWAEAGIMVADMAKVAIVHNTLARCDAGINIPHPKNMEIDGNIIAGVSEDEAQHIYLEDTTGLSELVIERNIIHQPGGTARLRWQSDVLSLAAFRLATGEGVGAEANPLFVSPTDFHLRAASPAVDAATINAVYADYLALHGIPIACDFDGRPRPIGAAFDAGALEFPLVLRPAVLVRP